LKSNTIDKTTIGALLDTIMRADGGRLLASLIGQLRDFQLAEDCLQDAMASAVELWPKTGEPTSPRGWILLVAKRKALDRLRRAANFKSKQNEYAVLLQADYQVVEADDAFPDERLRLIFTCCHPALDEVTRIALTLRTLGGLTTTQIARAFLVSEDAMAQRLVRARHKIAKAGIRYDVPDAADVPHRRESVLNVIYLIFNEGYASRAEPYVDDVLMQEAIRLARMLLRLQPDEAETEGLLALMLLHHARMPSRLNAQGETVPLDEQVRSQWGKAEIKEGLALVETALKRRAVGVFQIQASISALHAEALTFAATDWPQIVMLYGELLAFKPNPVIEINRISALSYAEGPDYALKLLQHWQDDLQRYQPFHALKADVLRRLQMPEAIAAYDDALTLTRNPQEHAFLQRQRSRCYAGNRVALSPASGQSCRRTGD
jgi:RNA polymerase sigma-70 factor, ECF subfamily